MKKGRKKSGACIFCGQGGVSKQHMWPEWMAPLFPDRKNTHSQVKFTYDLTVPGHVIMMPDYEEKRGPLQTRKIRNVCRKCNSEWMSRFETAAMPYLMQMISGQEVTLGLEKQRQLSAWIVMTAIVAEYTDLPTQAIPPEDRRVLMETKGPPEGWGIWIA